MSLLSSGTARWRETLAKSMPARLTSVFQANARQGMLKQVSSRLLVFEDRLVDLNNGSWRRLEHSGTRVDAEQLATAAADLLQAIDKPGGILLLLPAHEFLASTVKMPGIGRDNLRSALNLQAHVLLPGYDEPLALAVNTGERSSDAPDVALWMNENRINAMFAAFAARDLLLAAISPRMLAIAAGYEEVLIEDTDSMSVTQLHLQKGVISNWMRVSQSDLEQDEFREQWHQASQIHTSQQQDGHLENAPATVLSFKSADDFLGIADRIEADKDYSFIPAGAEALNRQLQKGKRMGMLAAAVAGIVFIAFVPFILQSIQSRLLLADLQQKQTQAVDARSDQTVVREFEQAWGAYTEFPRQNLSEILLELQQVINPGVLTSFEIDEGFITIEGDSSDPQSLLEQLEQNAMFTEVDFARATNNMRYFIDLRLSTIDFAAYKQRHFPDAR